MRSSSSQALTLQGDKWALLPWVKALNSPAFAQEPPSRVCHGNSVLQDSSDAHCQRVCPRRCVGVVGF